MPYRHTPIITGEIYHVFNRSVARQTIFLHTRDYQRGLDLLDYYRFHKPRLRFSHYNRLPLEQKQNFWNELTIQGRKQIEFFTFCLMPNHVHFLAKELGNGGIANFMRNFQNSYAKYFNVKHDRSGSLFQSMFKAVRIESEEQLLHVARYIDLNPLTSYVIKDAEALGTYRWSSFGEYLKEGKSEIVDKDFLLNFFQSVEKFKQFTLDQVDYQRKLDEIKHLTLE